MRIWIAEAARMATAHSAARRMSIRVLMAVSIMVGRSPEASLDRVDPR
jgi:hypothetical protein